MRDEPHIGTTRSGSWTFLSNHGAALVLIAREADIRLTELAAAMEVTERAAQRVVRDLVAGGYVQVEKRGRRNHYRVATSSTMRHPVVQSVPVKRLVEVLADPGSPREP